MKKHYTIPFFIPHEGCPFSCIFCSQKKISGKSHSIPKNKIPRKISKYLKTISKKNTTIEVAFFGGSFTGIPEDKQVGYLKKVLPFIIEGKIKSVRLSTRPDFINQNILNILKKYKVSTIELGVQSTSDDILRISKRGHTRKDIKKASSLILKNKFHLGHQIMVGLPGSTFLKELKTARDAVLMKASEVRIYPTIVVKGTELARKWKKRLYKTLTEKEAIDRCAKLLIFFKSNKIRVLRCGLHPSEGLISGRDILAGPFHQAFGQKVKARVYGDSIKKFLKKEKTLDLIERILFNPKEAAYVIGYKRENAMHVEALLKRHKIFFSSESIPLEKLLIKYKKKPVKLIKL